MTVWTCCSHFKVKRSDGGPPETLLCVRCHTQLAEAAHVKADNSELGALRTAECCARVGPDGVRRPMLLLAVNMKARPLP